MTRDREEVDRAIDAAAEHAWEGHASQRMLAKLGVESATHLREHVANTVWGEHTECFVASFDREIYYDRRTNTRVILFYRGAGTCLVTRAGAREFLKQYGNEKDRHIRAGNDEESMPPIVSGGIRALHPEIGPRQAELPRRQRNGGLAPDER